MLERLSDEATKVLILAEEEARLLGHNFVGTEFLLLGLFSNRESLAYKVLASFKLRPKSVRAEVKQIVGYGSGFVSKQIPHTPRLKLALETAAAIATKKGLSEIRPEHLLLGIVRQNEGLAIQVLKNLNIAPAVVQQRTIILINEERPTSKRKEEPARASKIRNGAQKINIQDIQTRDDFIYYLRQPEVSTSEFDKLASWLEKGGPNESWLASIEIAPELLQEPGLWRFLALILLRQPETLSE